MLVLYGFFYNGMTEESSSALISLHISRENAEKSMNEHKQKALIEWQSYKDRCLKEYGEDWPVTEFGKWESWEVRGVNVLP